MTYLLKCHDLVKSSGKEAGEFGDQALRRITGKRLLLTFSNSYLAAYGSAGWKDVSNWHLFDWHTFQKTSKGLEGSPSKRSLALFLNQPEAGRNLFDS